MIRTARAHERGTALSFVTEKETELLTEVEEYLTDGEHLSLNQTRVW